MRLIQTMEQTPPPPTVMLVEDSLAELLTVSAYVKKLGFQLVTASNGQKAVDYLEVMNIDLIVSDWRMPELDGLELCQYVNSIPASSRPYFIMLTGKANTAHMVASLDAGADDYMVKPCIASEFRLRVTAGLKRSVNATFN